MFAWVFFFVLIIACAFSPSLNLYQILGIEKSATQSDVKKAYRRKARATHPDKNPGIDPEVSTKNFREVVQAYEVLSDTNARREYDLTGHTPDSKKAKSEQNARRGNFNNQYQNHWNWNFNFGWNFNQERKDSRPKHHRLLYDRMYRHQILDAQSRVLSLFSLEHLESVALAGDDSDFFQPGAQEQRLERYVLLAFYDSSMPLCENKLSNEVLFPWPFAGYSSEAPFTQNNIWWDEVVLTGKIDLNSSGRNREGRRQLGTFFGFNDGKIGPHDCPTVMLLPRGGRLSERRETTKQHVSQSEDFRDFIWPQLKMTVLFENTTPWILSWWWLNGFQGEALPDILIGETTISETFLSHSFFFRAKFVEGHALTNESGLLWYTARMQDDNTVLKIKERCFDLHGDCRRWAQEGFCDRKSRSFYVIQNPTFVDWVLENCFVSCKTGCGSTDNIFSSNNGFGPGKSEL